MTITTRHSPGIPPTAHAAGQAGFTVMELLLGIAVLAIVTTLALPAFTQFIQNNRLSGQANEMVASFQFARSEALKRGVPVRVCSSSSGTACGGNWNQGWIALADPGGTPEVLRVWSSPGTDFQLTQQNAGSAQFTRQGCLDSDNNQDCDPDDNRIDFDLQLSGATDGNQRRVSIDVTGRVGSCRLDATGTCKK